MTPQPIIDTREVMLLTTDGSFRKTKVTVQRNVHYMQSTEKTNDDGRPAEPEEETGGRGGGNQSNES